MYELAHKKGQIENVGEGRGNSARWMLIKLPQ